MDHKYLSNLISREYKAAFFDVTDAIDYVLTIEQKCRRNRMYCEDTMEIGYKNIIVKVTIWESPEDN